MAFEINIKPPVFKVFYNTGRKLRDVVGAGAVLAVVMFLISGCATGPIFRVASVPVDRFQAFAGSDGRKITPKSVDTDIPDVDILALNREVKSMLDESVLSVKRPKKRMDALVEFLIGKVQYDTKDDSYGARTAQETYDAGTANCLSFSNLFVATARYAGLTAKFQEVPTPPNWIRSGEVLFFTRHIGASVDVNEFRDRVVQLGFDGANRIVVWSTSPDRYLFSPSNLDPFGPEINPLFVKPIPDHRAFAQYYNNLGSQHLAEGNSSEAFRYFVKAIKMDPYLSFAWSNLGVTYSRNSQLDAAESAFLQGMSVVRGPDDVSALTIINNMVKLYQRRGDKEKADFYVKEVASFREKNPYYHYAIAKNLYRDESYEQSIKHFKAAIHRKADDHLFYYGLALAYFEIGDLKKMKKNIDKAKHYAWDDDKKAYYDQVRDMLVNVE